MIIREEQQHDWAGVHYLVCAAFGRQAEALLVDRLRAEGDSVIALVARDDAQITGHVMLSRMNAPFKALGLAPVAVLPECQRSGVGSALIREALARARQQNWAAVFVLGDPQFYRRFGFDPGLAARFASPYSGPHLMVVPLHGDLPTTSGSVDYAPAFAALE
jgi:putative acetyltransferase